MSTPTKLRDRPADTRAQGGQLDEHQSPNIELRGPPCEEKESCRYEGRTDSETRPPPLQLEEKREGDDEEDGAAGEVVVSRPCTRSYLDLAIV